MDERAARARAFEAAATERAVERHEPFARGLVLSTPSLPHVWDLNLVRVERSEGASAVALAAEADRLQGPARLTHRRIAVADEGEGERLAPGFRELGWSVSRYLTMVAERDPARDLRVSVQEVELERLRDLRAELARDAPGGRSPEVVEELLRAAARHALAGNARHFAVFRDGRPVAAADLYSDGRTAQVEDVATLPEHRRRGFASALVARGVAVARESGHDLVFLRADADDRPKDLYARLGFEPVALTYAFTRTG